MRKQEKRREEKKGREGTRRKEREKIKEKQRNRRGGEKSREEHKERGESSSSLFYFSIRFYDISDIFDIFVIVFSIPPTQRTFVQIFHSLRNAETLTGKVTFTDLFINNIFF